MIRVGSVERKLSTDFFLRNGALLGGIRVSDYSKGKIVLLGYFFLDNFRPGALNTVGLIRKY